MMAGREKRVGVPVSRGVFFPGEVCCYGRFGGKMPMSLVVRMGGDSALISLLSLLLLLLPLLSTARDTPRLMWITYTIVSASPTSHSPVFPSVHVPGVSASWACRRNDRLFHVSPPPALSRRAISLHLVTFFAVGVVGARALAASRHGGVYTKATVFEPACTRTHE